MSCQNEDISLRDVLIGLTVGVILVYIFFKSRQTQSLQPLQTQSLQPLQTQCLYHQQHMQNLTDGVYQIGNKLKLLESTIDSLQSDISSYKISSYKNNEQQQTGNGNNYKNDEVYKVMRDKNGYISKLRIARNAKITG